MSYVSPIGDSLSLSLSSGYSAPADALAIDFTLRPSRAKLTGDGYLSGKLTGHDPIIPATIRILYRPASGEYDDGYLVALVAVNSVGEWRVENLNPALRYDVVARREGYNDVITAGVQPLPM